MNGNRRTRTGLLRARAKAPFENALDTCADASCDRLIANSRSSGQLNLSNRHLHEVPAKLFQQEDVGEGVKWWEVNELSKLDLSRNELQHLPGQMWSLTALNTLHLSFNKLQQLPAGVQALELLKLLDVSENPLTSLPEEIADLPALASLNCSNCHLQFLPDALGQRQPHLSAVNAAGNQLTALPAGLASAGALVMLNVSKNQLTQLPANMISSWTAMKELDVSFNQLQELPAALGSLPRLATLDVKNNQLSELPCDLGKAISLLELKAGFNRLTALPPSLGMLVNLKTLDVRNNLLQELPDTLCGLHLVLLDLTNNSLIRLPPGLGFMTTLRSMPLDGNRLKLMRRELWSGPISTLLQHLRDQMPSQGSSGDIASTRVSSSCDESIAATSAAATSAAAAAVAAAAAAEADRPSRGGSRVSGGGELVLRSKGLTSIPAEVWQSAASLSKLDLSLNNLSSPSALAPAQLATLNQLKVLCLNSCNLTSWPLWGVPACTLESLHTLELRMNPLQGPLARGGFACCPALRSLDLSGVKGLQLKGDVFQDTPQLEVLLAANAGLGEFPTAVLACTGLQQLVLSGNSISSMPVEVTQLTRLTELDLTNNQLSNLPPQVGLMSSSLRVLQLEGNCLRTIRRPILEKGTAALLEYLKDRIPV